MKKVFLWVSTGIVFTISGCSGNSQTTVLRSTPAVVQASAPTTRDKTAANNTSPAVEPAAALPVPSVLPVNKQAWRVENVRDHFGNAIMLKETSSDGKFDLIIMQRGTHSFLSFVKHERGQSVCNQPGKGKLMYLRVEFEDGQEKRIEWDELGFGTNNLCGVLWSYPAKADLPIGPVVEDRTGNSVGGDQLLIQDMMKHKTMLLEVEPGVTAQFDTTGIAHEIENARTSKTQPVIEARQTAE